MFKINLHAHTQYSDGQATIAQMAEACKDLEFTACVITDHVYMDDRRPSVSQSQYLHKILPEAREVQEKVGIPVIVGAEFSIGRMEECLVFGTQAITELYSMRQEYMNIKDAYLDIADLAYIRDNRDCAVILCHPSIPVYGDNFSTFDPENPQKTKPMKNWITQGGVNVIDGYEGINSGQPQFGKFRNVPKEFDGLISFCNSDAHSVISLSLGYNETASPIYTEDDLIRYIKGGGVWKHHTVPWRYE
jgi:hypothetical protein